MTDKEKQIALEKWYDEYCYKNGVAPTWGELVAKNRELLGKK